MKLVFLAFISLLLISNYIKCDDGTETPKKFNIARYSRVLNAIKIIFFGEDEDDDLDDKAQDMYIDTKKGVLSQLGKADDAFTLDEILIIFLQSIIIVITQKRYNLLSADFSDRHPEFGSVMKQLATLLDRLRSKGTGAVTLGDLRPLIKDVSTDEFWKAFDDMYNEVRQARYEEAAAENEKDEL